MATYNGVRDEHGYIRTDTYASGWSIVIIPGPDLPPSELAKRIVRHTFGAEFMQWIGETVGPSPDASSAYYDPLRNILYVTQELANKLSRYAEIGVPVRHPQVHSRQNQYTLRDWYAETYPTTTNPEVPDVFSI